MKNLRTILTAGILAGSLLVPAISAVAHAKDRDRRDHERRDGYHRRVPDYRWRQDAHNYKRNVYHDNRGHHNKPEIRQDFKGIRSARNEIKQDRRELRGDYKDVRKDRLELRRDLRNHASKDEILKDRQDLRNDYAEIKKDRTELRHDQGTVQSARNELKTDLRKR